MKAPTKYSAYLKCCTLTCILLLFAGIAYSQPCLPNGITFSTQAEVDSFPIQHPNCDEIMGYVSISGDISDLSPLDGIRKIHAFLGFGHLTQIYTLDAFPNLEYIGGTLSFGNSSYTPWSPRSIQGFNSLDTIMENLWIEGLMPLQSIAGFPNLEYIGGNLRIENNHKLTSFCAFPQLKQVEGQVAIFSNDSIEFIQPLANLKHIGGLFQLSDNPLLKSGDILHPKVSIEGGVNLFENPLMHSLPQLYAMRHINGPLFLAGLGIEYLDGMDSISSVGGDLIINDNNKLKNLTALSSLDSVFGDFRLQSSPEVKYLSGLHKLKYVSGQLTISAMDKLVSLGGLGSVHELGSLVLNDLPLIGDLSSLKNIELIHLSLKIAGMPELSSLHGLDSTRNAKVITLQNNAKLSSLTGIGSWNPDSISYIHIVNNPSLTDCAVESICAAIHTAYISNNASGCNTAQEVGQQCIAIGLELEEFDQEYGFYPIPFHPGEILKSNQYLVNACISLYSADGRLVSVQHNVSGKEIKFATGSLSPGLYILEIAEEHRFSRMKLVVRNF